ncbi:MAG: hypothetical protein DRR19_16385 [Candidatus Parabeggiatoa sp. nov. 1]|nr:MAG: hypothetical protein DRR19_16385 [Gammaproteobacteria bacterium]
MFPVTHQQCLMRSANGFHFVPLQRFLLIILSLFIGALTHIAWDSLTHQSGWVVVQLPILSLPIIETSQVSIKVYKVLQYGSTLLGATLLLYWYLKWLKQAPSLSINALTPLSTQTKWLIIFSIGLSASFVAGIYGFVSKDPFTNLYSFYKFVGLTVVAGILCVFVELMIFSAFWHLNKLKHRELWLTKG